MVNKKYELDESSLIEGFDPSKLHDDTDGVSEGWQIVIGALRNTKVLQAEVEGIENHANKTCAVVFIEEVKGLIPVELFGANNKRHLRTFVGTTVAFTVMDYDRDNNTFVASRKEAQKIRAEIKLRQIEEGDAIPLVVNGIRSHGLYGDIGGIQAYIPASELSYGWIKNIFEEYKIGDHMRVKVLKITEKQMEADGEETEEDKKKSDKEKGSATEYHVRASAKALHVDPWSDKGYVGQLMVGAERVGTVTGVNEHGSFVNLSDGVDSFTRTPKFDKLRKGDKVTVKVQHIDREKQQIVARHVRLNEKAD